MPARTSKSTFLYDEVRTALQAGRYVPGERIDPNALAEEFSTSPTPVLYALHRLVGEGMIADHAREGGFHVPLTTELMLRDLYDWMQRLLVMACDIGFQFEKRQGDALAIPRRGGNIVLLTRALFDDVAFATGHHYLHLEVQQTNDRLGPIRQATQPLLVDPSGELADLGQHWRRRDLKRLKAALIDYHERRKRLVPNIVALIGATPTSHVELQRAQRPASGRSPTR